MAYNRLGNRRLSGACQSIEPEDLTLGIAFGSQGPLCPARFGVEPAIDCIQDLDPRVVRALYSLGSLVE